MFTPISLVQAERPTGGLVATAITPTVKPDRWQNGISWRSEVCPTARGFDPVCGLESPFAPSVGAGDGSIVYYRPVAFRVEEECSTRGNPGPELISRVRRQAEAVTSYLVARELQDGEISRSNPYEDAFGNAGNVNAYLASADANVLTGPYEPMSALGRIEEAARVGSLGQDPFIHVPVRMVPLLAPALVQRGNLLFTYSGARVVADAGYTGTGELSAGTAEIQTVTLTGGPSGGTFTLTHPQGGTTAPIPFNANGADVEAALLALDGVDVGDLTVSGISGGSWTVTYTADQGNVAALTGDGSGLTGGVAPDVSINTPTPGVAPAAAAGDWMYATGPVVVLLDQIHVNEVPDWRENRLVITADRVFAAAFDPCNLHAIEVEMPAVGV